MTITLTQLQEAARAVGAALTDAQAEQLVRYRDLLLEWNARFNLTAITDDESIVARHFADSLSVLPVLSAGALTLLDVGTGAGLPGIPLKIARPDLRVTLMDGTGKKVAFCQAVIDNLRLTGIRALHGRAEEAAHQREHRERYDAVVARALAPMRTLLEYLLPFTSVGGCCIAMKGSDAQIETEQAAHAIGVLGGELARVQAVTLPNLPDQRALVVIRKSRNTPRLYPRQAGKPRTAPL